MCIYGGFGLRGLMDLFSELFFFLNAYLGNKKKKKMI